MRSRISVTHATASPQTPPTTAASKSKKQTAAAAQPSGKSAPTSEENA